MSANRSGIPASPRSSLAPPTLAVAYAITFIAFFDTLALLPTVGPYAEALGATDVGVDTAPPSAAVCSPSCRWWPRCSC